MELLPKALGGDMELSCFVLGGQASIDPGLLVLRHVDGVRDARCSDYSRSDMDYGRVWLTNGGCVYLDQTHLEYCIPLCRSAREAVAATLALRRICWDACERARQSTGLRIMLAACDTTDGGRTQWGSHSNVLMRREPYELAFFRTPHLQGAWLASALASLVWLGSGCISRVHHRPRYVLSQRALGMVRLSSIDTVAQRGMVNLRDEPLSQHARMHNIFFDAHVNPFALWLRFGILQILTAQIEAGACDPALILGDPVGSLWRWNADLSFSRTAGLLSGHEIDLVGHQRLLLDGARRFCLDQTSNIEQIIPGCCDILQQWSITLDLLANHDLAALARRLDWALKRQFLQRALEAGTMSALDDPRLAVLEHRYHSLDPAESLFMPCLEAGLVERVVSEEEVLRMGVEAPRTRAFARATLLSRAAEMQSRHLRLKSIDWEQIEFEHFDTRFILDLPDPLSPGNTPALQAPMDNPGEYLRGVADACGGALREREVACNPNWSSYGADIVSWSR